MWNSGPRSLLSKFDLKSKEMDESICIDSTAAKIRI